MTNSEIRAWLDKLEAHAPGEAAHGERVSVYAVATADRLGGLDLCHVRATSALHDLGKLLLPSELFEVGHDWSAADVRAVRKHVELPAEGALADEDVALANQRCERLAVTFAELESAQVGEASLAEAAQDPPATSAQLEDARIMRRIGEHLVVEQPEVEIGAVDHLAIGGADDLVHAVVGQRRVVALRVVAIEVEIDCRE